MVAKAPADGYTLLQVVTPDAINPALYSNLSFDFIRDIAPVIYLARLAYVVVVNPSVPATTLPEFIAYAKANPGKINYGSAGPGHAAKHCLRALQDDDRGESGPRPVSGRRACGRRSDRRPRAGDFRSGVGIDPTNQGRQAARPGGNDRDPFGRVSGRSNGGRLRAWL